MKRFAPIVVLTLLFSMSVFVAAAANSTVVVHPGDMNGWAFISENTVGGSGSLVSGPVNPPAGSGSANLVLTASNQGYVIGTKMLGGTKFTDITELTYSTYRTSGSSVALAPSLQFAADYDVTDGGVAWQGRLVYEPYRTHVVTTGEWQTWDTMQGLWWATGAPGSSLCGQGTPCTWNQVIAYWPDAGINANDAQVLFKVGSGWDDFNGNVDAFTISVAGVGTTYDFEPLIGPPTTKDECKNGGWMTFNNPAFGNQGECVSYVASQGKSGGKK